MLSRLHIIADVIRQRNKRLGKIKYLQFQTQTQAKRERVNYDSLFCI